MVLVNGTQVPFSSGDQYYTCSATGIVTDPVITLYVHHMHVYVLINGTMKEHFMVTNKSTW
ncbi:MAG: hypothetical protein CM15mV22_2430 [Eurybiavirus sp.]|nr:MAG: hypothetical protein CM15mV22_2430 [Eurybiavirus sp.]